MATPNYSYEKRQRELAKKRKLEEKKQRKLQRGDAPEGAHAAEEGRAADAASEPPAAPPAG